MSRVFATIACDYKPANVEKALREIFELAGGIDKYIIAGERVLLKVNMVDAATADSAVTTHPEVVRGMIRMVKAAGAVPYVGDSPGLVSMENAAKKCGIYNVCCEENVEMPDFSGEEEVRVPNGCVVKKLLVTNCLKDFDKVISVAKMKTHTFMGTTGAVKNMFGIIPGTNKAKWHFNMQHQDQFARLLLDICNYARPAFSIVDAITGMEGNGPRNGKPKFAGMLLGGINPYAVDAVMTEKMGFDNNQNPLYIAAFENGLVAEVEEITVSGSAHAFRCSFKPPKSYKTASDAYPKWLLAILRRLCTARPAIRYLQCAGCGECMRVCPANAIRIEDRTAVIDDKKCIRCFCCQEFCPADAVKIKRGLLSGWL